MLGHHLAFVQDEQRTGAGAFAISLAVKSETDGDAEKVERKCIVGQRDIVPERRGIIRLRHAWHIGETGQPIRHVRRGAGW